MKGDGEHKLEELSRRFGVLDDEFARSTERADNCDKKVNIVTMISVVLILYWGVGLGRRIENDWWEYESSGGGRRKSPDQGGEILGTLLLKYNLFHNWKLLPGSDSCVDG